MTPEITIFRLDTTNFVNVSKYNRADYTKTTKLLITFHPK